jgi:gliding motility-associated-like protein
MINVHPKPPVDAGPDRIMLINNPVTLSGSAAGDQVTYSWTPDEYISDTAIFDPVVSPPSDITYTLTARSTWGCTNGDGKNDRWEIPFLDSSFGGTVNVFDRWGQLVYHVSSEKVSWDGTMNGVPQASGVYVYWITLKNYGLELKGTFTLIR